MSVRFIYNYDTKRVFFYLAKPTDFIVFIFIVEILY